jgi:hypothetical protein
MTEAEWLVCWNPKAMLKAGRRNATFRRTSLFACACARRIWRFLTDDRSRNAVIVAEEFVEGLRSVQELLDAIWDAQSKAESAENLGEDAASYAAFWAGGTRPEAPLECAYAAAEAVGFFAGAETVVVGWPV